MKMGVANIQEIYENKVNGNITDFWEAIRKLSKLELLDYIEYARGQGGIAIHNIVADLRRALAEEDRGGIMCNACKKRVRVTKTLKIYNNNKIEEWNVCEDCCRKRGW